MPPRKLNAALLFIFIAAVLRIIGFDFNMTLHREQSSGRTSDRLYIRCIRKSIGIVFYTGKEAGNGKFLRAVTLTLAASQTGNFADFAFVRSLFRIVAVYVDICIGRNEFDDIARTDRNAGSTADTQLRMNHCQIVDDLNRSERTLAGAAAHSDTAVGAAFGTAGHQNG